MTITTVQKQHLNKMNRSSQDVLLGDIIDNLTSGSGTVSGSFSGSFTGEGVFGNDEGYTYFDSSGAPRLSGCAVVWDDLRIPLTQTRLGANSKPDFDFVNVAYLFPQNNISEGLYFIAQMPHAWKIGGDLRPHVHWMQTQSGSVVFKLDYKWVNVGGSVPSSCATIIIDQPTQNYVSGSLHQLSSASVVISGSGKTLSSLVIGRLYRDDDTYTGDAITYDIDLHYEIDSLGSNELYTK